MLIGCQVWVCSIRRKKICWFDNFFVILHFEMDNVLNINDAVLNLIRTTVRTTEPDAQIILYGSRARGDARENSDWDVIVLLNKPAMTHSARNEIACDIWEKGLDIGKEINTFVYTIDQWNSAPLSLFKYNVMNEGIRL